MSTIQETRTPLALTAGKRAFIAGIDWQTLPPGTRDARTFAREQGADRYIHYRDTTGDDGDGGGPVIVGAVSRRQCGIPAAVHDCVSLALLITPLLRHGGWAVYETDTGDTSGAVFGFVSVIRGGVLVNDETGSQADITAALNTFTALNPEPDEGWVRFAPAGFFPGEADITPLPLDELMTGRGPLPAGARLRPVSRTPQVLSVTALVLLTGAALWGWQQYGNWQAAQQAREAAAREEAARIITPPWPSQPETAAFIRDCTSVWSGVPLSVAGTRLDTLACTADGSSGTLRVAWRNPAGISVSDFSRRVHDLFSARAFLVLPQGDAGGVSLPVTFTLPSSPPDPGQLPQTEDIRTRLTALAQQHRMSLTWQETDNSTTDAQGQPVRPPWREFSLNLETGIPPSQLSGLFSEPALRFQSVVATLSNGRFTYRFTGTFYAQ